MNWRCFHCDFVATTREEGREHFGTSERLAPACQVDASQLRAIEAELARYREEDTDLHRALHAKDCAHAQALRREEEAGYARGLRDARGQFGVAVELLRETLGPLEVCAATIESEDGGALMESLLGQVQRFVADVGVLAPDRQPDRQPDVTAALLRACNAAAEWLQGWASAEPYLSQLQAAIKAAEAPAAVDPLLTTGRQVESVEDLQRAIAVPVDADGAALRLVVQHRLGLVPPEGGGWDVERYAVDGRVLASCANSGAWALREAIADAVAKLAASGVGIPGKAQQ